MFFYPRTFSNLNYLKILHVEQKGSKVKLNMFGNIKTYKSQNNDNVNIFNQLDLGTFPLLNLHNLLTPNRYHPLIK